MPQLKGRGKLQPFQAIFVFGKRDLIFWLKDSFQFFSKLNKNYLEFLSDIHCQLVTVKISFKNCSYDLHCNVNFQLTILLSLLNIKSVKPNKRS